MTEANNLDDSKLCCICYTDNYDYVCSSCQTKMCNECIRRYITEYPNLEPHCMNCNSALPFPVIYNSLGKIGVARFFNESTEVKFQLEKQKIPECLECCNKIISMRSLKLLPRCIQKVLINMSHINVSNIKDSLLSQLSMSLIEENAINYNISVLKTIQELIKVHPFYTDEPNSFQLKLTNKDLAHLEKSKALKLIIDADTSNNQQYKQNEFWTRPEVTQYFKNMNFNPIPLSLNNVVKLRKQLINTNIN